MGDFHYLFSLYAIWVAFHLIYNDRPYAKSFWAIGNLVEVLGRADAWVTRLIVLRCVENCFKNLL